MRDNETIQLTNSRLQSLSLCQIKKWRHLIDIFPFAAIRPLCPSPVCSYHNTISWQMLWSSTVQLADSFTKYIWHTYVQVAGKYHASYWWRSCESRILWNCTRLRLTSMEIAYKYGYATSANKVWLCHRLWDASEPYHRSASLMATSLTAISKVVDPFKYMTNQHFHI